MEPAIRSRGWRVPILCALAVLLLGLTACGGDDSSGTTSESGGSKSTEGVDVAFAGVDGTSPLFGPVTTGAEEAVEGTGINLKTYDNKLDPEVTLRNAQTMVEADPDVIVDFSPSPEIGSSVFTIFDRAGIPCIALSVEISGCSWLKVDERSLGSQAGEAASKAAEELGWDGSNTTVLLLNLPSAGQVINDTTRYFYTVISESLPGFEKIPPEDITESTTTIGETGRQIGSNGTLEGAFTAVKNVLPSIPASRNIMLSAVNDDAALGGWRALEEAGRADRSIVVGQGGSSDALQQLRTNPKWVAEVSAFIPVWGYYAVALAAAIADGADVPDLTYLPRITLTPETVDRYYAPNSDLPKKLPPLPSNADYLKGYGVLEGYGG
jgi:ribose transport system substrate-binding protein